MEQIRELLQVGLKSRQWLRIEDYHLCVYLRLTDRYLDGSIESTIDLASIDVDKEYQRQGHFTAFLTEVETMAQEYSRTIYVETIVNNSLFDSLKKRGYRVMSDDFRSLAKSFK